MATYEDPPDLTTKNVDRTEWVPISLTLVEYPKGDLLGEILAFISLAPLAIGVGFVTLIIFRRDMHTITFFIGSVLCELLNCLLKYIICEPRPITRQVVYNEYGMPSSHSQFMWFFATYVVYFVFIRLHHMNNNTIMENLSKFAILSSCILSAIVVSYSRYYLQYHTFFQIFWGGVIGWLFATVWFILTCHVFTPLYPQIVSWRISEFFLLRDTTLIPNVLWFEYTNTRQEVRARSRKLVSMKSQ